MGNTHFKLLGPSYISGTAEASRQFFTQVGYIKLSVILGRQVTLEGA